MSYILEALKKAQAERQLGGVPTIHAEQFQNGPEAEPLPAWRKPLWLGLGAAALLALLAMVLVWKQTTPGGSRAAAPAIAPLQQDVAAAVAPAPAAAAPAVTPLAQQAAAAAPVAPPAPSSQMPLAAPRQSEPTYAPPRQRLAKQDVPPPPGASGKSADAARRPPAGSADSGASSANDLAARAVNGLSVSSASGAVNAPAAAANPAAIADGDTSIPFVRDLPEPIQRQIPALALGGYIYSKNAPDRLLLIDKVLRREGEEVAPGVVLEKLQPKSAVFSFKGYRYRIPY